MKRINMTHLAVAAALAAPLPVFGGVGKIPLDELLKHYATYNYHGGVSAGSAAGQPATPGLFSVIDIKLDFAAIAAARSAAGQAALGAADIMELIPVRAGMWVQVAAVQVVTAEGAAATGQLGDGADPDGFIATATLNLNSVGWSSSLAVTAYSVAVGGGRLYTADDTIDLTLDSAAIDVAVCHVFAALVDLRQYR